MGNLLGGFKRFFSNKNTVTILAVIAGVLVLWFFYNMRVNEAITLIKIPYAKEEIGATEEITAEHIGYMEVSSKVLTQSDNAVIQSEQLLIGKYVTTGTSIPEGGMFYSSQVVEKNELPNAVFDDIPTGHTLFTLSVNNNSTYGNSIYPGDKIDLYAKFTDDLGIINFGNFISSIEVLAVRDSGQNDVFESTETKVSAYLLFTVPNELFGLLSTAIDHNVEIIPVPRNKEYTEEGAVTQIESQEIRNYIEVKSNFTDQ